MQTHGPDPGAGVGIGYPNGAKGCTKIILMDETGEILVCISIRSFDPPDRTSSVGAFKMRWKERI